MSAGRRGQGLLPVERLRHARDFEKAYKEGQRLVSRYFVAFVVGKSGGPLCLGVVASRRVGGAVERNRAKRLLREVFRRRRPERAVSANVVLVARRAITGAAFHEVDAAYVRNVGRLLEKIP